MSLSGYIIEKYNRMTNAYTCNRLVEEAKKLDIDLRIIGIHDTSVGADGIENSGELLEKRDFVIHRYKWGKLKSRINQLCTRSYNPMDAYDIYINKFEQVSRLVSEAFIMPKYVLATSKYPYEKLADRLSEPFVAKGLESSMGAEIFLIQNRGDYDALQKYGEAKEWLFEEFVSTSVGRDIRFYSIRGEVAACMTRISGGDFRANVALGAQVRPYEVTPAIRKIAGDIYEQTGLDFLGIDLMFGEDKPYFCEINVMPGIEGIEKATGVNVARKIIETIRGDFISAEEDANFYK